MQSHTNNASILLNDLEIQTYHPDIEYPSLKTFLETLDNVELNRHWSEQFLTPLTKMGVQSLDDIYLVASESLHLFFWLPPIAIMDLYSHILETIQAIHNAKPLLIARYRWHFEVSTITDCKGLWMSKWPHSTWLRDCRIGLSWPHQVPLLASLWSTGITCPLRLQCIMYH